MPEMPEVETLARKLRKTVLGKRVAAVKTSGLSLRRPIESGFGARLRGRVFTRILRRGKYLLIELDPKGYLLVHLGMTGKMLYHEEAGTGTSHTHATIRFSDDTELEYRDHRRFGLLAVHDTPRLDLIPEISDLGKDPLSAGFNEKWLWPLLQNSSRDIKAFLLDQRKIAGLGNIYVCEALFLAQIHPTRRCFSIDPKETAHLAGAIQKVLRIAIKHKGTTFSDFMDSEGKPGGNQDFLMVFQREGLECVRCGAVVQRLRQGNRSSFYCSRCQG